MTGGAPDLGRPKGGTTRGGRHRSWPPLGKKLNPAFWPPLGNGGGLALQGLNLGGNLALTGAGSNFGIGGGLNVLGAVAGMATFGTGAAALGAVDFGAAGPWQDDFALRPGATSAPAAVAAKICPSWE